MTERNLLRIAFILLFVIGLLIGTTFGQEAVETAPETHITAEVKPTTPETPRVVSRELLNELKARQADFEDAQKLVNYVLAKIVAEYQVDFQVELLNIDTGEIVPRTPAAE